MHTINNEKIKAWSQQWPKLPLSDAMEEACIENKDVIVLAADLAKALGVYDCIKYPNQYFNLGICEQNMIGIACGLAMEDKIPVATSFVPFLTMRAFEQIRTSVAYMNLNVKLIGGNAGVRGGKAASSHYGLEDITIMRSIPNMVVLSPSDGLSAYKAIHAMIRHNGPAYLRLAGVAEMKIIYEKDFNFEIGKAIKLKEGNDVMILATGPMVASALDAIEIMKAKGIKAGLYDFQTIKPLDIKAVFKAASSAPLVVTIEEHTILGGFGSAVAEVLAQSDTNVRFKILGLMDKFMKIAPYKGQLAKCGLLPEQIAETIESQLK